jgi:hypothetical protein
VVPRRNKHRWSGGIPMNLLQGNSRRRSQQARCWESSARIAWELCTSNIFYMESLSQGIIMPRFWIDWYIFIDPIHTNISVKIALVHHSGLTFCIIIQNIYFMIHNLNKVYKHRFHDTLLTDSRKNALILLCL